MIAPPWRRKGWVLRRASAWEESLFKASQGITPGRNCGQRDPKIAGKDYRLSFVQDQPYSFPLFWDLIYSVSSHPQIISTLLTLQSPIHSRKLFAESKFSWKLLDNNAIFIILILQPSWDLQPAYHNFALNYVLLITICTRSDHSFSVSQRTKTWDEHLECWNSLGLSISWLLKLCWEVPWGWVWWEGMLGEELLSQPLLFNSSSFFDPCF